MKPIIVVMLAVQVAMFLVAVVMIGFAPATRRRRPVWPSIAISLVIVAATSYQIAGKHVSHPGADVIQFVAPLLMGMGIMAALARIRQRRGLN